MLPTRKILQLPAEQPLYFDDFITRDNWKKAQRRPPVQISPMPATNVYETENTIVIELVVPGLSHEDLRFFTTDSSVEVRYEPDNSAFEPFSSRRALHREYEPVAFRRQFDLNPEALEFDQLEVSSHNGIVRLEFPKREQFRGRVQPFSPFSLN